MHVRHSLLMGFLMYQSKGVGSKRGGGGGKASVLEGGTGDF